jgi:flagellar motor switch protein FliM
MAATGRRTGEAVEKTVQPCNFRSAGRLSNESARALKTLHESLARNLMNTLDVYLGTALEVKLHSLEQLSMDDYRASLLPTGYVLPCALAPASHTLLLEMDSPLLYTMIDLLLGGTGATTVETRELTEIDEEIVQGVVGLMAQQIERAWQPIGVSVTPGAAVRAAMVHKLFPPTEKVLLVRFEIGLAGTNGSLHIAFPASVGGHLVRNIKADPTAARGPVRYFPRLPLEERILDCKFTLSGGLPEMRVPVRELAALAVGSVFRLGAPVEATGRLALENKDFFEAVPVRSGKSKAVELIAPLPSANWTQD